MLAPVSVSEIKEMPRDFYKSILKRDMFVLNAHGDLQEPVTEKNVIHFSLQPEKKAFEIYDQLLEEQSSQYPTLSRWVCHVRS
ncbi:MAG: hypothetical protein JSS09_00335 [Verrucomicrobia bacterium]|nr:hypothetical protein [Verrucomicrobiota bacterium]